MFCSRCGTEVQPSSKFCPTCGLDLTTVTQGGGLSGTAAQPAAAQDDTAAVRDALKDEYELEKELGRGGMAIVYKARDKALEREVAIKILPFSLSFDAEFVERFQREARTSAKLEHPNIIPIYRVGKSGRVIFFVMKFLRGKPLSNVIEARGALPVPEIKRVLIEAGRALGYAHKHGIVHRDIKPDNIMFDELGQAIVTDFGIAKAQSGARLTGTGRSIGTPHYMSPEQARAQNLDGRSDVYSLGVVGYQCLTGHVPFDGEDSFSIGYKHIMEELPTPPLETAEQRELFAVIQKMMAKKAEDRFQTAEELVGALEGSGGVASMMMSEVATRPTEAIKSPPGVAAIAAAATTPLPRASASMGPPPGLAAAGAAAKAKPAPKPRPEPKKKSKAPLVVFGLLVVVGAGLAGYLKFGRQLLGGAAAADTTAHTQQLASHDTGAVRAESVAAAAKAESLAAAARAESAATARTRTPRERTPPRETPPRETATSSVSAATCAANPSVGVKNPGGACYDRRPSAKLVTAIDVPSGCTGTPSPATMLVKVTATGDVESVTPSQPSNCAQFTAQANAYVKDLTFVPAQKSGQPVAAWIYLPISIKRH
jgi:serine/threonine protein kinase